MVKTIRGRVSNSSGNKTEGANAMMFAALAANFEIKCYGSGKPLYELVKNFGVVHPLNTLDSALMTFAEIKTGLKPGEAAFSYSEEYNRFGLAMKMPEGGIAFCALLHDHNGTPIVDEPLHLCWVKALKDFDVDGETVVSKGEELIKAVPETYLKRMAKAA